MVVGVVVLGATPHLLLVAMVAQEVEVVAEVVLQMLEVTATHQPYHRAKVIMVVLDLAIVRRGMLAAEVEVLDLLVLMAYLVLGLWVMEVMAALVCLQQLQELL
jgi:hypothetical protein